MSQAKDSPTAAKVAEQVLSVIQNTQGGHAPPSWTLVGGKALLYWLWGFVQTNFGWPMNRKLIKAYGLDKPAV